ncbi:MAG: Flp pilus assembly complex ATPase component TadA [Myxococcales bacterium]|nr:Flp pilus assembly complex ATPase component TadA [Myxococcales bacterium]
MTSDPGPPGGPRRITVDPAQVADFLASTPLFLECDRATIDKIAPHVFAAEVKAGTVIVRAGTTNPGIGFLYSGQATVKGTAAEGGEPIEAVVVGDSFGDTGAFLGTAQPWDVVAEQDCVVLLLGSELIAQIASRVAPFSFAAARRLARRVITTPPATRTRRVTTMPPPINPAPEGVIPFVRVAAYEPTAQILSMIPAKMVQQHRLLPLQLVDRKLTVGMVDPFNSSSRSELQRLLASVDVTVVAISQDDFNEAYVRLRLDSSRGARGQRIAETIAPESLVFDLIDQEREAKAVNVIGDEVVILSSRIIAHAIERGASDVHIELDVTGVRVRFRVQGQLHDWDHAVPAGYAKGLVARLKILAGLDITERRLPQDGRIGIKLGRREVDLRISTLPSSRGEKIALRVFEAAATMRPLESIFHDPRVLTAMRAAINRPYGAIVIAGPTGSGKTSSLYAALGERRRTRADTNLLTVEDPIEYRLSGITQVQVNHAVDLTFAKVLRAMLRQDPDAVMVGEVRDSETAQLAVEAAMTGHLLFTSLHANNSTGVIQRLENLGCSRPLIAQALALVLVQRLVRRLCQRCATVETPPPVMLENLVGHGLADPKAPPMLPKPVGCAECNHTGYAGRVAVIEMLQMGDAQRAQVMTGASMAELERKSLDSGALVSFRQSALFMMEQRLITPSEALLTVT